MQTAEEFKLDYKIVDESREVTAIIAAAGASSRMKGVNKQFVPLLGIPVLARTLLVFEKCSDISGIIVAAAKENIADVQKICDEYNITKLRQIVAGGDTRLKSVYAAAVAAHQETGYYAIHDGARPLVSDELIKHTLAAARLYGAAAPGVLLKDTIKTVDKDGFVETTPDRSRFIAVQTPQIIKADIYMPALRRAYSLEINVTDDCSMIEEMGKPVKIVEGDYRNIKITTQEDIASAQSFLLHGGEDLK